MASLFYLPWAIVRDVAGVGIPGAQVYFTQTATNTKKSVYQDSGLVTPHTNPVVCDGVGNPPITYLDPTVSYRVRVYDRDAEAGVDTPIKDIDPYVPGIFADATALQPVADDAANSASAATSSAAIAASAATEAAASAVTAAAVVMSGNAALVAIEAAVATTGFTLAQLMSSGLPLNVKWFGVTGNGVSNDQPLIQAVVDLAAATGQPKVIYFPTPAAGGFYKCDSQLDLSLTTGVTLRGDGNRIEPTTDTPPCPIVYTGTATPFIKAGNSHSLTLDGLALQVSNAGFVGDILSCDTDGTGRVTYSTSIVNCMFGGKTSAARHARSCLNLCGAVEAFVDLSTFGWADHHIIAIATDSVLTYSNAVTISRNRFSEYGIHAINIYAATQWTIENNVFELQYGTGGGSAGVGYGISDLWLGGGSSRNSDGVVIINNGFWDGYLGQWIDIYGSGQLIQGNFAVVNNGGTFLHFNSGFGAKVSANRISGSAGGKFLDISVASISGFVDDGSNVINPAVTYSTSPSSFLPPDRSFQDISARALSLLAVSGVGGQLHARKAAASAGLFGGGIYFDRNDDTNWRGGGVFSYLDSGTSKECIAFTVAAATTAPTDTSLIKMLLTEDGDIRSIRNVVASGAITSSSATAGIGYATGAGGAITQITSRTTGVTLNTACGAITLVSAAGSTSFQSFTVTNSTVAATDVIRVVQKSGTDKYAIWVTAVAAGSFQITFATLSGTTTEQPVFNFAVIKAVAA